MSYTLTNALHDELDAMLRRMMVMWSAHHDQPVYSKLTNPHIPKVSTQSGLMDIIAVGILLELSQVLDRRSYYTAHGIHWREQHEIALARHCYRAFQSWFTDNHRTTVGGKSISPIHIFHRCLVEFAAAVIVYKQAEWAKTPRRGSLKKCTAESVQEKTKHVFQSNFPELLPCLQKLVKDKVEFLYWTGPPITILCTGTRPKKDMQLRDFEDRPIYLDEDLGSDNNPSDDDNPSENGNTSDDDNPSDDDNASVDDNNVDKDDGAGKDNSVGNSGGKEEVDKETASNNLSKDLHEMPMVQDGTEADQSLSRSENTQAGESLLHSTVFWWSFSLSWQMM